MDGSGDAGYELPAIHGRPKVLRAPSVKELQHAARRWAKGEENVIV